jgi:hypothetical protein
VQETVKVQSIEGLIIGPYSATFKRYMESNIKDEELQSRRHDQWRYLTVITPWRSYDFIIENLDDSLDVIISINEARLRLLQHAHRRGIEKLKV